MFEIRSIKLTKEQKIECRYVLKLIIYDIHYRKRICVTSNAALITPLNHTPIAYIEDISLYLLDNTFIQY